MLIDPTALSLNRLSVRVRLVLITVHPLARAWRVLCGQYKVTTTPQKEFEFEAGENKGTSQFESSSTPICDMVSVAMGISHNNVVVRWFP